MYLEKIAVIDDGAYHLVHVVRLVGTVGNYLVERIFQPADGVGTGRQGRILHVVLRDIRDEFADEFHRLLFGRSGEIGHTRLAGVHRSTAELLLRHILARHGLHYGRTGKEHVARIAFHNREVGQRRRIDRPAGTRAENDRNLGYDARSHHVALKYLGIAGQRVHPLLDACTTRVVEADTGSSRPHGHVHHLAYLLGHRLGQRTARYGEILCEDIDQPAVDGPVTGYHAVAVRMALLHAEVVTTMRHEHVELLETALIQKHLYPFAGRVLSLRMLRVYPFLTATQPCFLAQLYQLRDLVLIIAHMFSN